MSKHEPVESEVREQLKKLDGTTESAVSLLTGFSREKLDDLGGVGRPYYAPFTPADPKTCTCIDPFSDCPTHG